MLRISISFKTATQAFRACLMLILVTTTPVQGDDLAKTFPIQDGSVVCRAESDLTAEVVFPYMPFLSTTPTWSPSLPQYYGQPVELVPPVLGLGGSLQIGVVDSEGHIWEYHLSGEIAFRSANDRPILNRESFRQIITLNGGRRNEDEHQTSTKRLSCRLKTDGDS